MRNVDAFSDNNNKIAKIGKSRDQDIELRNISTVVDGHKTQYCIDYLLCHKVRT